MYSPSDAAALRDRGHDTIAINEHDELRGLDDVTVLIVATLDHRAVVTENVSDFARLHAAGSVAADGHAGSVAVRAPSPVCSDAPGATPSDRGAVPTARGAPRRPRWLDWMVAGSARGVERSTTGRKRAYGADNGLDGTACGGPCRHLMDGVIDLAKVRVAGANPVVRSKTASWRRRSLWVTAGAGRRRRVRDRADQGRRGPLRAGTLAAPTRLPRWADRGSGGWTPIRARRRRPRKRSWT